MVDEIPTANPETEKPLETCDDCGEDADHLEFHKCMGGCESSWKICGECVPEVGDVYICTDCELDEDKEPSVPDENKDS